jgi:hypothetical protein
MALIKRFNTSYTLKSINASDTVTMDTSLVTITGNLIVLGNQTSLSTTNTAIFDNIITLNAGLSPSVAPTLNAGIEVDRGTLANVQLRWYETVKAWQITSDGSVYANIATTASTGSALTAVLQDTTPVLGGNLNITSRTIYTDAIGGSVQIYANTAGSGGSGVYVTNTATSNAELVTKAKAVAYSIVFG